MTKRIRISLLLEPKYKEALDTLSEALDKTRTQIIKDALAVEVQDASVMLTTLIQKHEALGHNTDEAKKLRDKLLSFGFTPAVFADHYTIQMIGAINELEGHERAAVLNKYIQELKK